MKEVERAATEAMVDGGDSWMVMGVVEQVLRTQPTCLSVAGFQSESNSTSRFAPIRLIPQPPALLERRKQKAFGLFMLLNWGGPGAFGYVRGSRGSVDDVRSAVRVCSELQQAAYVKFS